MKRRALTLAGYFLFFDVCFVVAAILMFPLEGIKPLVIDQAEKALGKGKQGRNGVDPVVTIGELGMSGLGVAARRVQVQLGNTEPEPGPTIELDRVRLSASLLSLFSTNKTVQLDADLYKGSLSADVTFDPKQNVVAADIDVDDVELGGVGPIIGALGMPVEGKVDATIDVELGATPEKDGKGRIEARVTGLTVGPGNLKAVPGGFEFEQGVALGTLVLKAPIEKGQGELDVRFEGTTDLEAEVTGTINLRGKLPQSRLDVDGWFRPVASFLEKNGKIKSALEIGEKLNFSGGPSLSKAKDSDGRYHFEAKGALQTLKPQLSRDAGRRAARKRGATAPAPELPEAAKAPKVEAPPPPPPTPPAPTPEPATGDAAD